MLVTNFFNFAEIFKCTKVYFEGEILWGPITFNLVVVRPIQNLQLPIFSFLGCVFPLKIQILYITDISEHNILQEI